MKHLPYHIMFVLSAIMLVLTCLLFTSCKPLLVITFSDIIGIAIFALFILVCIVIGILLLIDKIKNKKH